ncbi:GYDIA family GHMP kinase [Mangrovibacterium lignilyticum]|uniref:GYDIA family GHMP kinase n=1 Tax=Mangrovibacterium lignilyticum TaxID=2668052 RepID=UPI0013D894BE|nr:GYDIA family GHMP kinase [Mangrovibacterium lignilyticum]
MIQDVKTVKETYQAHGKLLLTAEYFVLRGAKSIALPLQYGQRMEVAAGKEDGILSWKAFMQEGLWFSCDLKLPDFEIVNSSDAEKAVILRDTFRTIQQMNPAFEPQRPLDVHTYIDFNNQWGLGSSSTLIANLASWAKVDPFKLNELVFHGSGFDIACATAKGPIFYTKNEVPKPVNLDYSFLDQLYFIYSGAKKSTRNEVRRFLSEGAVSLQQVEQMNQLSDAFAGATKLDDFQKLIVEHEAMVSALLDCPTVKSQYFSDFNGEVKSLGAWGGDFYLIATPMDDRDVLNYFKQKGLRVVFPWRELVLNATK